MSTDVINNEILVGTYKIKANGTAVTINPRDFVFVEVEQNLYVPSMAIIRLRHMELASIFPTTFALGTPISVEMGQSSTDAGEVFSGEVIAQEVDASPTGIPTITIRAYDKRHRLMRGRKIKTYVDVSESDLVSQTCSAAGLSGSATGAPTEVYKWVIQNNETDMEFLSRRARRLGMELVITGSAVKMQKPTLTVDSGDLTYGEDLLDFKVRLNTTNQVNSVTVRGWDPATKAAIVGTSSSADFKPAIGITKDGAALASDFGSGKVMYTVYRSVTTQADAALAAKAIHNDLNGRAIQIQGRCFGSTHVKVGARVEIKNVGTDYNGKYYVTASTHRFDINGYLTHFESNGKSTNNILDLTNQDGERGGGMMSPIIGVVSNIAVADDAKKRGQLKVKYTTLGDSIESDWMPLVQPMAGASRGFFFMPEVNDEVLVAFENGDINRPFALGAVWNGTDATPLAKAAYAGDDGKIKQRIIQTTSGHKVTFDDSSDAPGITIVDKTGKNKIFIDSTNNKITIESDAEMLLKAKTKMTIEAADLDITVTNKITQKGGQIDMQSSSTDIQIKSTTDLKLTGGTAFEAKGTSGAKVAGLTLELKGDTTAKLEGGVMTEIKGGLIKLN